MKNLLIAFVRQKYNPYGGAERFVERALHALVAYRVEMTVFSREWDDTSSDYRFISCDPFYIGRLWRDWSFRRSVCHALQTESVDLVQSHERIPCIDIYRAGDGVHKVWLLQKARASGWWTGVSSYFSPYHRYVLAAEKKMFESPALKAVICNSDMVRDEIIEHFAIDAKKCHVIYTGVDTDAFHPGLRQAYRSDMRRQLGIGHNEHVLLYVGSGFFRKGLQAVIESLAEMEQAPSLVVVGNDRHIKKYKKQAKKAGLQERIHFVGPQKDVKPYYGMADVFILPSIYDPFPNAILEAMACALPVITSYNTGAAEFIDDGVQGYVVDALNKQSISLAIEKLSDPAHALQLGKHAREKVEPYHLDAMADKLVNFYTDITKQASRAHHIE